MEKVLDQFETQQCCTAVSGLNLLAHIVKLLLLKPYPNLQKKVLEPEYDFVVIGAGSGGATCASRLSENPNWTVALIEAGGEEPEITRVPALLNTDGMFGTAVEWGFKTEPHPEFCNGKPCTYGRAKMMGGCDGHNGMWYLMGNRRLFDDLAEKGYEGWSFEEVLPYYMRRYHAHELQDDGTMADLSVERFPYIDKNVRIIIDAYKKELGIKEPDRNGNIKEGYVTTSKNGTRISVNRLYIEKKRYKRKNLHVITEAYVLKIIIDPKKKVATAVEVLINKDGQQQKMVIKARKEVILSAGIINTAKILQLSGIGPKELLEKYDIPVIQDLPVGYSFLNHPVFHAIKLKLTTTSTIPSDCEAIKKDIKNYIDNKSGPLASTGAFNSYLLAHSSTAEKDIPDVLFAFNPSIEGIDVEDQKFCTSYYDTLTLGVMSGMTDGEGTVLIKSKDPLEPPAITPGVGPWDKHLILDRMKMAHELANSETFKKHGIIADNTPDPRCKHLEYATYDYWKCAMQGKLDLWLHGMGTCRMGPKDDPKAVTDTRCRVRGIKGLRVVDASISPNVTNANINSVVLLIGERCSDFIIMDHLK